MISCSVSSLLCRVVSQQAKMPPLAPAAQFQVWPALLPTVFFDPCVRVLGGLLLLVAPTIGYRRRRPDLSETRAAVLSTRKRFR